MTQHADQHDDRLLQFALADPDHPVWEEIVGQLVECEECRTSAYAMADDLPNLVRGLGLSEAVATERAGELIHRLDEVLDEAMQRLAAHDAPAVEIAQRRSWLSWAWMPVAAAAAASLVIVFWPAPPPSSERAAWSPVATVIAPEQAVTATDSVLQRLEQKGLGMVGTPKPHDFLVGYARGLESDLRMSERVDDQKRLRDMLAVRGIVDISCVSAACTAGETAYGLQRDLNETTAARILRSSRALTILEWAGDQPHLVTATQVLKEQTGTESPGSEEMAAWRALIERALNRTSGETP